MVELIGNKHAIIIASSRDELGKIKKFIKEHNVTLEKQNPARGSTNHID